MTPARKTAVVAAGYVGGLLVASLAVAIRVASTSGPEAQASSGMYAFGDLYLFIAVFGIVALAPTGAALYWLRPYRRFWLVLSTLAVGIAMTSAAAAVLYTVGRDAAGPSALASWAGLSVLRILLAPPLAPVFLVGAFFARFRFARIALLMAAGLELAVVAYAGLVWFIPP